MGCLLGSGFDLSFFTGLLLLTNVAFLAQDQAKSADSQPLSWALSR
jgi:hypothetical protein